MKLIFNFFKILAPGVRLRTGALPLLRFSSEVRTRLKRYAIFSLLSSLMESDSGRELPPATSFAQLPLAPSDVLSLLAILFCCIIAAPGQLRGHCSERRRTTRK